MIADAQVTVRNAGLLLAQRVAQVASGLLFAMLVPRLMGPEVYGRYALVASIAIWFVLASALGFTQVIGRHVPPFVLRGDRAAVQRLFDRLLAVRLMSGLSAAGLYLLFTALWLRDYDPLVLVILAGAVFARAVGHFLFAYFLGFNMAARWGMGQILRGWVSLALLLAGFHLGGLTGACAGLLLTEVAVLVVAAWWLRPHLSLPSLRPDVRGLVPYLGFGLTFFASNLLLTAFRRSGEAIVRVVSGDYAQVGYFGLAYDVYLTAAVLFPQLTLAFAPWLTLLRDQGHIEELEGWVERLLKGLTIGGVMVVFGAVLVGDDLVPVVFGAAYRPVAANLIPLALTLVTLALSSVARLLALVYDQARTALASAGLRLIVFWMLAPPLVARLGSMGGCLAVLAASVLYSAYFVWRMRSVAPLPIRRWAPSIALGCLFLPLMWLRSSWEVDLVLYVAFLLSYAGVLYLLGVVTPGEVTAAWRAISGTGARQSFAQGEGP